MILETPSIYDFPGVYNLGGGKNGDFERVFLTYFDNVVAGVDYPEIGENYIIQNPDIVIGSLYLNGGLKNCQKVLNNSFSIDLNNYIIGKRKAVLKFFFKRENSNGTTRFGVDSPSFLPHIVLPVGGSNLRSMFTGNSGDAPDDNTFLAHFTNYQNNFAESDFDYASVSNMGAIYNCITYVFDFIEKKSTCLFKGYPLFSCKYEKNDFAFFAESLTYYAVFTGISLDVI